MPDADALRLFLAVMPDAGTARELETLARHESARCGGHPVRRDALHLTLCFLGSLARRHIARIETIAAGMSMQPACDTTFDHLTILAHDLLVLEATVPAAPLLLLQTRLQQALHRAGFPLEQRRYRPHITLLRHVDPMRHTTAAVAPVSLCIDHLALLQSTPGRDGSEYLELQRWSLQ